MIPLVHRAEIIAMKLCSDMNIMEITVQVPVHITPEPKDRRSVWQRGRRYGPWHAGIVGLVPAVPVTPA
jgi:hypothetical protein